MAKSAGRVVAKSPAPARVKTSFSLSAETFKRLGAACVAEDMSQSEIAEWLFSRHLSGYYVGTRGDRVGQSNGPAVRTGPVALNDRPDPGAEISAPGVEAA